MRKGVRLKLRWTSLCKGASAGLAFLLAWLAPVEASAAQAVRYYGGVQAKAVRLRPQAAASGGQWVVFRPVSGTAVRGTLSPAAQAAPARAATAPAAAAAAGSVAAATPQAAAATPQAPAAPAAAGGPAVVGSDAFRSKVQQALALLQARAPASWEIVRANLRVIREAAASGAYVAEGRYDIGPATAASDPVWLASTIVHDAYHVQLYREGRPFMGAEAEAAALAKQREALVVLGAPSYMIAHLDNVMATRYWEVPYFQRNW